jgi:tetratricopeptide (TPR) repeat protein
LYNKVTKQISKEINVILTPQEENLLAESKTVNPEAYDAYMKGQFYLERLGNEDLKKAIEYFQNAIEKAPNWAPPYNGLSSAWGGLMQSSRVEPTVALPKVYEYLNKALELDPNFVDLQRHLATLAVSVEWNWEKGEKAFLKALELNPNDALCRIYYAHFLMIMKRPEEALKQANLALELDPLRPLLLGLYGRMMIWQGDCQSALMSVQKALSIDPENRLAQSALAKAYYCMGDTIKWFESWKRIAWWDDKTLAVIDDIFYKMGFHTAVEKIIEVNVEESQNLFISMQGQAWRYLAVGKYDKAMDCLEREYEIHDPKMPYLGMVSIEFEELKNNTRYIALMKKMKLPI